MHNDILGSWEGLDAFEGPTLAKYLAAVTSHCWEHITAIIIIIIMQDLFKFSNLVQFYVHLKHTY